MCYVRYSLEQSIETMKFKVILELYFFVAAGVHSRMVEFIMREASFLMSDCCSHLLGCGGEEINA